MNTQKLLLIFLVIFALAACVKTSTSPAAPVETAPVSASTDDQNSCQVSEALFKVEADDLKDMLTKAGLTVDEFSISGTGQANSCTTAYSNALHFMQVTLTAPDEDKATLGDQLNLLTNMVNDWLILTPAWNRSHMDKYNIYMTITINPGNHQLSKTPADILLFSNQGLTKEAFWDAINK